MDALSLLPNGDEQLGLQSRSRLVIVAAQRARQIMQGAASTIASNSLYADLKSSLMTTYWYSLYALTSSLAFFNRRAISCGVSDCRFCKRLRKTGREGGRR